jgi:hypothetical protein
MGIKPRHEVVEPADTLRRFCIRNRSRQVIGFVTSNRRFRQAKLRPYASV